MKAHMGSVQFIHFQCVVTSPVLSTSIVAQPGGVRKHNGLTGCGHKTELTDADSK